MLPGKKRGELQLRYVAVLKLVDKDEFCASALARMNVFVALEKFDGANDEQTEAAHLLFGEHSLDGLKDIRNFFAAGDDLPARNGLCVTTAVNARQFRLRVMQRGYVSAILPRIHQLIVAAVDEL